MVYFPYFTKFRHQSSQFYQIWDALFSYDRFCVKEIFPKFTLQWESSIIYSDKLNLNK